MDNNSQQINISFVPKEDRLLLKVKTGENLEYRVWLTRRFIKLFIQVLNDKMDGFGGIDSIAVSEETQKVLKQGALEEKYTSPEAAKYPLGENGILATKIKTNTNKDNIMFLQILPEKGKGININLDKKMLYMIHNLLSQGINHASWDINTETPASNQIH